MAATENAIAEKVAPEEVGVHRSFILYVIGLLIVGVGLSVMAMFFAGASAGGDAKALEKINAGDTAWMIVATALVMVMTPAVGFFYGGMVRSKNVISIIKQSIVALGIVSLQWVLIGYSLAFGQDVGGLGLIGSFDFFGLRNVGFAPSETYGTTIPHLAFMMFQGMFAIITPALIIGSFAERIRFRTLVLFLILWSTLVYDPLAHWVWSANGWLFKLGALDFAGGTVVHISAGFAGLAAALVIGRRVDHKQGQLMDANNVPFVLLGAGLLWFGWFGFNAGSALSASSLALNAIVVTNTAAAACALTWMLLSWAETKKPSAMATATGAVCGLVAITPASGYVGPIASLAIGVIAGLVTYLAVFFRNKKTRIDDSLDVWGAHGMGGLIGAVLTGVFAEKVINAAGNNGLLFGNPELLLKQVIAVAASAAYAFIMTFIILKVLSLFGSLRVSKEEEIQGLDMAVHGEEGYRL